MKLFGFRAKYNGFPGKQKHGVVVAFDEESAENIIKKETDQILWVHVWPTPIYIDGPYPMFPIVIYEDFG